MAALSSRTRAMRSAGPTIQPKRQPVMGISFGEGVEGEGAFLAAGGRGGRADVFEFVVDEEVVDVIGEDDEIMLDGDAEHFAHVGGRDDVGGRIIGGDQQEGARFIADSGADIGRIGTEVVFGEGLHFDLDAAGEGEGIGVGIVVGFGHESSHRRVRWPRRS